MSAGVLHQRNDHQHQQRLDAHQDRLPPLEAAQRNAADACDGRRAPDHDDRASLGQAALNQAM